MIAVESATDWNLVKLLSGVLRRKEEEGGVDTNSARFVDITGVRHTGDNNLLLTTSDGRVHPTQFHQLSLPDLRSIIGFLQQQHVPEEPVLVKGPTPAPVESTPVVVDVVDGRLQPPNRNDVVPPSPEKIEKALKTGRGASPRLRIEKISTIIRKESYDVILTKQLVKVFESNTQDERLKTAQDVIIETLIDSKTPANKTEDVTTSYRFEVVEP